MNNKPKGWRPPATTRIGAPKFGKDQKGQSAILCPFCIPTHPIVPGYEAMCGTALEIRAVQPVYKARFYKGMVCAKCGKDGDQMVRFQNAFIHIKDCTPGVATLTEAPKFTKVARVVYNAPRWIKARVEKKFGQAMPVDEILPDGTRTGHVIGYFFLKGKPT